MWNDFEQTLENFQNEFYLETIQEIEQENIEENDIVDKTTV